MILSKFAAVVYYWGSARISVVYSEGIFNAAVHIVRKLP